MSVANFTQPSACPHTLEQRTETDRCRRLYRRAHQTMAHQTMTARYGGQHTVRQSIESQGSKGFSGSRLGVGSFLTAFVARLGENMHGRVPVRREPRQMKITDASECARPA